jgi:UDP-N-acetylmuramate dehydrogenase
MNYLKISKIAETCGIKKPVFDIKTSGLCSMGAGGKAAALITADSTQSLAGLLTSLKEEKMEYAIIGSGTNIVFTRDLPGLILIKLGESMGSISIDDEGIIEAGASASMSLLVKRAASAGLDLSFMAGIPGTLGGAVCGNSGSSGRWIYEAIQEIKFIRRLKDGFETARCGRDEMRGCYRSLDITDMAAIVSIILAPARKGREELQLKIRRDISRRKKTQPIGAKTSGCFFKNPGGRSRPAGILIDECGLKGFSYGGARVSPVHANFIENFNSALPEDIVVLSRIMIDKVREKFGISLEYEVRLIG